VGNGPVTAAFFGWKSDKAVCAQAVATSNADGSIIRASDLAMAVPCCSASAPRQPP
jgi:hypothetical protein